MATVSFENVSKRFDSVRAVDDVSFHIPEGEIVCLLGPSGCGKTTTLRMIAGLENPTEGVIRIGERDVTHEPPRRRDIGMVFQDYALYPHMTISENIAYPLKVRGIDRDSRSKRAEEVAERLQIRTLLGRRPGEISGGQQQRTSVARALVHTPQVFLFDEPLSNLDAKLRLEARSFIKHLQKELGVTAIYVTHDQSEAMALADTIAVMNRGRIEQMGAPLEVYRRPATTFVADFLGSPPMNLLPATPETRGGVRLTGDGFTLTLPEALASRLEGHGRVRLGVRPEHLTIAAADAPDTLEGSLYAVEPLGAEWLITVEVGGTLVTARLFGDDEPSLQERVWLRPAPDRYHLFDDDGRRIGP